MKALTSLCSATTLLLLIALLSASPRPAAAQADQDCEFTCEEEGGGGGAGCVDGQSRFVNSICSLCYVIDCSPLPCRYTPAQEGTWVTKKCVGGVWVEAWEGKPCGTC